MSLPPASANITRECVRAVDVDFVKRFWHLYGGTMLASACPRGDRSVEVHIGCPQAQQAWRVRLDTAQSWLAAPHRPQWGDAWALGQPFAFSTLAELLEQLHASIVAAGARAYVAPGSSR